jgi:hypothetical protein
MQTATTTCDLVGSSTICITETIQNFIGGFSYGEVLMILLLLMIFTLGFFSAIKQFITYQKINNYYAKK